MPECTEVERPHRPALCLGCVRYICHWFNACKSVLHCSKAVVKANVSDLIVLGPAARLLCHFNPVANVLLCYGTLIPVERLEMGDVVCSRMFVVLCRKLGGFFLFGWTQDTFEHGIVLDH